jgi:S-adenosylmethionine synthetase
VVRAETATKTGMIMIFGEITTKADVNYETVIREAIRSIGYDDVEKGACPLPVECVIGGRQLT